MPLSLYFLLIKYPLMIINKREKKRKEKEKSSKSIIFNSDILDLVGLEQLWIIASFVYWFIIAGSFKNYN